MARVPTISINTQTSSDTVLGVQGGVVTRFQASPGYGQLSSSTGSSLVGHGSGTVADALNAGGTFTPSGTGAIATTIQAKLQERVSVFDFMTDAQKADVKARTRTIDVSGAINSAIAALGKTGTKGGSLFLPPGSYRIDSPVVLNEDSIVLQGAGLGEPSSEPVTELWKNFNGTGLYVSDMARSGQQLRWGVRDLVVNGNGNTGDGIYVNNAHYGHVRDVVSWNNAGSGSAGVRFYNSYSNELHNVQSILNYRNFHFENQSNDITATKCYSASCTDYGCYVTTSYGLTFTGFTHEGTGAIAIWVNRAAKGVVFQGGYIEVDGSIGTYSSCIRISEDTTDAYACEGIAIRDMFIMVDKAYVLPVVVRSGVKGCEVRNINVTWNNVALTSSHRCVLLGWAQGAVAVMNVQVSSIHSSFTNGSTNGGMYQVGAAANVNSGTISVIGVSTDLGTAQVTLGGTHLALNAGTNGNEVPNLDFVNFTARTSQPTSLQNYSLVYADGATWNPTSTGEGLHVINGAGVLARVSLHKSGATAARPTTTYPGMTFFDTTLGKPIWRNAADSGWVDATGTSA